MSRNVRSLTSLVGLAALVTFGAGACDMIKVKGVVKTTTVEDGKTTTKTREFNSFEEMPAALSAGADDMSEATNKMVEKLTEAPPPGEVKLGDLLPTLAEYEENKNLNFLASAKTKDGKPYKFKYVQIGVPSYDEFFKSSMEFYALIYQVRYTTMRIRKLSATIAGKEDAAEMALGELIDKVMETEANAAQKPIVTQIEELVTLTKAMAPAALALVEKTQKLVASGQQLVAGAPSSITNPKTALHIDLIVEGLEQSVSLIGSSGELLEGMVSDLSSFA